MKPIAFGNYTLLRHLARGGMADLYIARARGVAGIERVAVVKVVSSRFCEDDALLTMFKDEVRIAATLHHPNIGHVIEVGEVGGEYYLAMEHIHGKDLRAVVEACHAQGRVGVPLEIALMIGIRVCSALAHAHAARGIDGTPLSIIHRDVSPSNIMLDYDGNVKLVDFGIAKAANRGAMTRPGCIKGKVRYLTPEQLLGHAVDRRADIFMLGTSLWEASVGQHLFPGEQEFEVYDAISAGKVAPPSSIVADFPADFETVLMKALAFAPTDRYPEAHEMEQQLVSVAQKRGVALSELTAAQFMRQLFANEIQAWETARERGTGLLEHLLHVTPDDGPDAGRVLARVDELATLPPGGSQPRPLPEPPAAVGPSPSASASPVKVDTTAQEATRRTILFGTPDNGSAKQRPATGGMPRGQTGDEPIGRARIETPLRVSQSKAVAITPDGQAEVVGAEGSPDGDMADQRATVVEPVAASTPEPPDSPRPTVIDPALALQIEESANRPTEIEGAVAADAAPIFGNRDSEEAAGRRRRPRTGDWAHQASDAEQRPGTHPYFRQQSALPRTDARALPLHLDPSSARRYYVVGLAIAAALTVTGLVLGLLASSSPTSDRALAPPAPIRLTSMPSGATVYRATDGQELGQTPLKLDRRQVEGTALQLHLSGYDMLSLTVTADDGDQHVELRPKEPPPRPTSPATPPPLEENRPAR